MNISWSKFEVQAPEIAKAGKRLLVGKDGVSIGYLATSSYEVPKISPVCPVFSGDGIYLVVSKSTPKYRDLTINLNYSLHAFLGKSDEEFKITGKAFLLEDEATRISVQKDIPFGSFDENDPIFELYLDNALWAVWKDVGTENTNVARKYWRKQHG